MNLNLNGRRRTSLVEVLSVLLITSTLLISIYYSWLTNAPLYFDGNFMIPYLRGNLLLYLSSNYPWYSLLYHYAFLFGNMYFGIVVNSFYLTLFAFCSLSMLYLTKTLNFNKFSRIFTSILYVANPFTLFNLYNPSLLPFFLLTPLLIATILLYDRTGKLKFLIYSALLIYFIVQLDAPLQGLAALRLVFPVMIGIGVFSFVRSFKKNHKTAIKHHFIALLIFVTLNIYYIIALFYAYLGIFGTSINVVSSAVGFNLSNLNYLYGNLGIINVLSDFEYPFLAIGFLWIFQIFWSILLFIAIGSAVIFRKRMEPYVVIFAITALLIISLVILTKFNLDVFLFKKLNILFVYEYPFLPESILILLDSILLGNLVNVISSTHTKSKLYTTRCNPRIYKKNSSLFLTVIVVIMILSPVLPLLGHSNQMSSSQSNSSKYLNSVYMDIGTFLSKDSGDYRTLILPLNYSTYNAILTQVTPNNLFFSPFASVNSGTPGNENLFQRPSQYPNYTDVKNAIRSIFDNNSKNLAAMLSLYNVKYVIVLNPLSTQNISMYISNSGEITLNGGGAKFTNLFMKAGNFSIASNNSLYTIFKDSEYEGPISIIQTPVSPGDNLSELLTSYGQFYSNYTIQNISTKSIIRESGDTILFSPKTGGEYQLITSEYWQGGIFSSTGYTTKTYNGYSVISINASANSSYQFKLPAFTNYFPVIATFNVISSATSLFIFLLYFLRPRKIIT